VNFRSAHNGIAITIDDAGVGMGAEELARAAELLSGETSVDIHRLGDPPQVGFAVAGVLAARYGFKVSVDSQSPYGGVRAVVFVPSSLLTEIPDSEPPRTAAASTAPAAGAAATGGDEPSTASGLPKRSRIAVAERPVEREDGGAGGGSGGGEWPPPRPARETARGLGAWQRGTRSGRAAGPSGTGDTDN